MNTAQEIAASLAGLKGEELVTEHAKRVRTATAEMTATASAEFSKSLLEALVSNGKAYRFGNAYAEAK